MTKKERKKGRKEEECKKYRKTVKNGKKRNLKI